MEGRKSELRSQAAWAIANLFKETEIPPSHEEIEIELEAVRGEVVDIFEAEGINLDD